MARARSSAPVKRPAGQRPGPGRPLLRGEVSNGSIILLVLCLIMPALAIRQACESLDWRFIAAAAVLISVVTAFLHSGDKRRAERGVWRTPEATLHLAELAGGWPAAFVTMRVIRHKIQKSGYQFTYWCIVALHQLVALEYLRDWSLTRGVFRVLAGCIARG